MIGLLIPTHYPLLLSLLNTVKVWLKFLKRVSGRVNFWQRYGTEVYLPLKFKLISSFIRTNKSEENLVKGSKFFLFGWLWEIFRLQGGLPPISSLQQGNSWRWNLEEWLYEKRLLKQDLPCMQMFRF